MLVPSDIDDDYEKTIKISHKFSLDSHFGEIPSQ